MVEALVLFYETAGNGEVLLVQHIQEAAQEWLSGVTVSSVAMGDASGSGTVNRNPREVLMTLKQVRDAMEGRKRVDRAQAGFANRYVGT
jgi:hypothetical protein